MDCLKRHYLLSFSRYLCCAGTDVPVVVRRRVVQVQRARALSVALGIAIAPGFDALVFKASRGIEDVYELTYVCKNGTRFPAVISITALRDDQGKVTHPSYPKEHYARIVAETGDHFYLRDESQESAAPSASTLGPASASVAAPPSSGISPPISSAPSPTKAKGGCAVGVSSASGEYAGLLMLLFGWMMKKRRGE